MWSECWSCNMQYFFLTISPEVNVVNWDSRCSGEQAFWSFIHQYICNTHINPCNCKDILPQPAFSFKKGALITYKNKIKQINVLTEPGVLWKVAHGLKYHLDRQQVTGDATDPTPLPSELLMHEMSVLMFILILHGSFSSVI